MWGLSHNLIMFVDLILNIDNMTSFLSNLLSTLMLFDKIRKLKEFCLAGIDIFIHFSSSIHKLSDKDTKQKSCKWIIVVQLLQDVNYFQCRSSYQYRKLLKHIVLKVKIKKTTSKLLSQTFQLNFFSFYCLSKNIFTILWNHNYTLNEFYINTNQKCIYR